MQFTHFAFKGEESLKEKAARTVWNPIINVGVERREKREQDAGRLQYTLRRKVLMEHPKNDGDRVWAAKTG